MEGHVRTRAFGLALLPAILYGAGAMPVRSTPHGLPLLPPPAAAESLPGRVVDVKAGEFFFQAPDTIRAGLTTFRLLQIGMMAERSRAGLKGRALVADQGDDTRGFHMLWVVRLDSGKTVADLYDAARRGERATPWATQLGGPGVVPPPRTTNATLDLAPGNYALVCYVGSAREDHSRFHMLRGMYRSLTVLPASGAAAALPRPDVVARIVGEGVVELSAPLAAGRQVIRVENTMARMREFKFHRMPSGVTGLEFLTQPPGEPGVIWGGLSDVPAGGSVTTTIDFELGEYVVGSAMGIRHATSRVVTVAAPPPGKR
jgi:hypothetical protein